MVSIRPSPTSRKAGAPFQKNTRSPGRQLRGGFLVIHRSVFPGTSIVSRSLRLGRPFTTQKRIGSSEVVSPTQIATNLKQLEVHATASRASMRLTIGRCAVDHLATITPANPGSPSYELFRGRRGDGFLAAFGSGSPK